MLLTANFSSGDNPRVSPLEDDIFAFKFIRSRKVMSFELGLFATKWFDYRFISPLEATKLYIEAYGPIYREIYSERIDRKAAEFVKPIDFPSLSASLAQADPGALRSFGGLWRGRQVADGIGMPYERYIRLAFDFRLRKWQQANLPQPQHLYHEFDVEKIVDRWEEMQAADLFVADHPAYLNQNYADLPSQNAHHEWLFKQVGLRHDQPSWLARFVGNDQLPFDKVAARVSDEDLARIETLLQ